MAALDFDHRLATCLIVRDMRHFRRDPLDEALLERLLGAA